VETHNTVDASAIAASQSPLTTPLFSVDPTSPQPTSLPLPATTHASGISLPLSDGEGPWLSQSHTEPSQLEERLPLSELEDEEVSPFLSGDESPRSRQSVNEVVTEEIRARYSWFCSIIQENESKSWGTAYRDFVDVAFLLRAVSDMEMRPMRNRQISSGVFQASMGPVNLDVWTFINILDLTHKSGTWRNKVTAYFRVQKLYKFVQSTQGLNLPFETQEHLDVLRSIVLWVDNEDFMLGDMWETQHGSKNFRQQLVDMLSMVSGGGLFCSLSLNQG
jgi:hypothetical protein